MANKMLIDASHQEETRVVVVRGNRVEEFDFESEHKKQLKGNIYLAKVTRVEPSLQAAFIEYGGNRHGFLAFSEIHPDYYQIPKADRQALIEEELARAQEEEEEHEAREARNAERRAKVRQPARREDDDAVSEAIDDGMAEDAQDGGDERFDASHDGDARDTHDEFAAAEGSPGHRSARGRSSSDEEADGEAGHDGEARGRRSSTSDDEEDDEHDDDRDGADDDEDRDTDEDRDADESSDDARSSDDRGSRRSRSGRRSRRPRGKRRSSQDGEERDDGEEIDQIGSEDAMEEVPVRQSRPRRQYKIQEVIKRRQILLVQVVKEERGNKGAALTTYLSLAGRYSVLMPNTARGGGISRKITNASDRKRLKDVVRDLDVPRGMGIILRTAGANRTKPEVKRDYEYLMRLWETVRTVTLSSIAPTLVYEEGSLIKRSIRDLYNKDIDQVLVAGDTGYREAKDFMRMLMPSQAKAVQPYRDQTPIFARQGIESQLEKMLQPHVTLKSGGYIIINQTEALVAIDVNSGRSTREHSIEDTATQTNLEAAEEVARQLRLRDLAGLIVVDFIDMDEKRNNRAVEKKIKECLKSDRARIQVGSISHFGLLEMSRQRIRASVLESTMQPCPICEGTGHVRSASSSALHVIRTVEEHLQKHDRNDLIVKVPTQTALYVLNEKRRRIEELEYQHGLRIIIQADDAGGHHHVEIEHGAEAVKPEGVPEDLRADSHAAIDAMDAKADEEAARLSATEIDVAGGIEGDDEPSDYDRTGSSGADTDGAGRKRRRRRRKRGGEDDELHSVEGDGEASGDGLDDEDGSDDADSSGEAKGRRDDHDGDRGRKRRRRGRRGGRRNRDDQQDQGESSQDGAVSQQPAVVAVADVVAVIDEPSRDETAGRSGGREGGDESFAPVAARTAMPERDPQDGNEVGTDGSPALQEPVEESAADDRTPHAAPEQGAAGSLQPDAGTSAEPAIAAVEDEAGRDAGAPAADDDGPQEEPDMAPAEPRVTSSEVTAGESTQKPRRTGWWARRSFF